MIPNVLGYGVLVRWGAALLFLALCCGGLVKCGYDKGTAKLEAERAAHKAVLDDLAVKTEVAAELAEQASKAAAIERKANDKRFDDAKRQADQAGRDLAAALRAGTQRLQPWWGQDCPQAAEGDAAADATEADARKRADDLGRVLAAAKRDAATMNKLYDDWKAEHDAVISGGCAVEAR